MFDASSSLNFDRLVSIKMASEKKTKHTDYQSNFGAKKKASSDKKANCPTSCPISN